MFTRREVTADPIHIENDVIHHKEVTSRLRTHLHCGSDRRLTVAMPVQAVQVDKDVLLTCDRRPATLRGITLQRIDQSLIELSRVLSVKAARNKSMMTATLKEVTVTELTTTHPMKVRKTTRSIFTPTRPHATDHRCLTTLLRPTT
jgi:hypothetical protein